jgi:hypothetical protein
MRCCSEGSKIFVAQDDRLEVGYVIDVANFHLTGFCVS